MIIRFTYWLIFNLALPVMYLSAMDSEQVLAEIFGKKAASNIVSGAGKAKRRVGSGESVARKKALAASRKVEVTEVKKYAGKDIV